MYRIVLLTNLCIHTCVSIPFLFDGLVSHIISKFKVWCSYIIILYIYIYIY